MASSSLPEELLIARKLIYKNLSQHRGTKHFAHFKQIVRTVGRLDVKAITVCLQELHECFGDVTAWKLRPLSAVETQVVQRATRFVSDLKQARLKCVGLSRSLVQLLGHGFFPSFALSIVSVSARLIALCATLKQSLQAVLNVVTAV